MLSSFWDTRLSLLFSGNYRLVMVFASWGAELELHCLLSPTQNGLPPGDSPEEPIH
jgi:hypothetical protein